jgi:hypothetical protein
VESVVVEEYKPILVECFCRDEQLLSKWHIFAGRGLDACVDKTFKDLKEAKVTFFGLIDGKNLAGYFCREAYGDQEFLTGFFLMPLFRTEKGREEFWSAVQLRFNSHFFCGVYAKNSPAIKFIESRGGRFVRKVPLTDGDAVLYELGE